MKRHINEKFFDVWSRPMAYVLGFFYADGYLQGGRRNNHPSWKVAYIVQVGSKYMFRRLEELGLTRNKSLTMKFPDVPEEFLGDFVRGYFDGDGCVHIGRYWRKDRQQWKWQFTVNFTSGSRGFLVVLGSRLERHTAGEHIAKKTGGHELVYAQWDSVALFGLMYNNASAGAFLNRKYNTFKRAFEILGIDM